MTSDDALISLIFPLDVEDDWPPVASESIPFAVCVGGYRALAAPLFVKDLSVGDVITADLAEANLVKSWQHVVRSGRTTVWLLRLRGGNNRIDQTLAELRAMGCDTVDFGEMGCYSVDVPETLKIDQVDEVLALLDESSVGVAFPSMRH